MMTKNPMQLKAFIKNKKDTIRLFGEKMMIKSIKIRVTHESITGRYL